MCVPVCSRGNLVLGGCSAKAEEEAASTAMDTNQRDLFLKRFGFHDVVTEDMIKAKHTLPHLAYCPHTLDPHSTGRPPLIGGLACFVHAGTACVVTKCALPLYVCPCPACCRRPRQTLQSGPCLWASVEGRSPRLGAPSSSSPP